MSNPIDGNEWIEFIATENLNISNITFSDNYSTDTFVCCSFNEQCEMHILQGEYFLLFDQDTTFDINSSLHYFCVDDNSIGNGLGNTQEVVMLHHAGNVIVNLSYDLHTDKGKTLSFNCADFVQTNPTPGYANQFQEEIEEVVQSLELEYIIDEQVYVGKEYNLVKITNNLYPDIAPISVSIQYNVTHDDEFKTYNNEGNINLYTSSLAKFTFQKQGNYSVCTTIVHSEPKLQMYPQSCKTIEAFDTSEIACNVTLSLSTDKFLYEEGESVSISISLSNEFYPYKIDYWVEDLFGTSVKKKVETQNTHKKSYTPKILETDKVFKLMGNLSFLACNNEVTNTSDSQFFIVKGDEFQESISTQKTGDSDSYIKLEVNEQGIFGQSLPVDIEIYKGNTGKYAISLYVAKKGKKISDKISFHVKEKYTRNKFRIPIYLPQDCDYSYDDGSYDVIVEGLGIVEKMKVKINHHSDDCKRVEPVSVFEESSTKKQYALLSFSESNNDSYVINVLRIYNNEDKEHAYDVWSYVYRGRTSYSGNREKNKVSFFLKPQEEKIIILQNEVNTSGNYSYKTNILRDDRKTPYEIRKNVSFHLPMKQKQEISLIEMNTLHDSVNESVVNATVINKTNKISGKTIYISSSGKIKKYLPLFLLVGIIITIIAWFKISR